MVKQGFRNANSLALRLMNAVSSANGRRKRLEQFGAIRAIRGAFSVNRRGNGQLPVTRLDSGGPRSVMLMFLHSFSVPR